MKTVKQYDNMIYYMLVHLFSKAKENNGFLTLEGFNKNDKSHLCLLRIAKMSADLFKIKLKIKMGIFPFIIFRKKFDKQKYFIRTNKSGLDCARTIKLLEDTNDCVGIYEDIYTDYYEEIDK